MNWNLRNRILVPMAALIVVLLLVTGVTSYRMSSQALDLSTDAQLDEICAGGVQQIEAWVGQHQLAMQQWANQPQLLAALDPAPANDPIRASLNRQLEQAKEMQPSYEALYVVNAAGLAIASSHAATIGQLNISDRPYFPLVMAGRPTVSQVLRSRSTGNPIVVVACPVKDGGVVRGVVLVSLDLGRFSTDIISRFKVLQTGYVFMFDETGVFIAHPNKQRILQSKLADFDWGAKVGQERNGEIYYTFEGIRKMAVFRTSEQLGWGLVATVPMEEITAAARRMAWLNGLLGGGALAAAMLVLYFTARSITRPIQAVSEQLNAGAAHTTAAANQVSTASQSLAAGSAEQAAALQETSASLEQMAGMAQRNSEHSTQASQLATQARQAADSGMADMQAMNAAMQAIKSSGDNIAKVVKTIDEIAFQTNLLALNAAVEAARAGETGAGFAIVAEEVRALAHRSATAAKETAAMVEDSIGRTAQGVSLSTKVARSLTDIVEKIRQVDHLVADVSTASREQGQGVGQINGAVSQMDQVVQGNAAAAEESAAAAEELNAQAFALRESALALSGLIDGKSAAGSPAAAVPSGFPVSPARPARVSAATPPPSSGKVRLLRPQPKSGQPALAAANHDDFFRNP